MGIEYLLDEREVFARAYAQWIASESGDAQLRRQIAAMRRPQADRYLLTGGKPLGYPYQWDDAEFAPIAAAMRGLFRQLGLLAKEGS